MTEADCELIEAIRDYCAARSRAEPDAWPIPAEAQARQRAYARVERAARELLEKMEP